MKSKVRVYRLFLSGALLLLMTATVPAMAAAYSTTAKIPVSCGLGGTIQLSAEDGAPAPENDTITLADKETKCFEITYEEPGNYVYTAKQINMTDDGKTTYDKSEYKINIFIAADDKELTPIVVISKGDEKNDSLQFVNTPTPAKSTTPQATPRSSNASSIKGVKTGDDFNMAYLYLIVACGTCLIIAGSVRKRKVEQE